MTAVASGVATSSSNAWLLGVKASPCSCSCSAAAGAAAGAAAPAPVLGSNPAPPPAGGGGGGGAVLSVRRRRKHASTQSTVASIAWHCEKIVYFKKRQNTRGRSAVLGLFSSYWLSCVNDGSCASTGMHLKYACMHCFQRLSKKRNGTTALLKHTARDRSAATGATSFQQAAKIPRQKTFKLLA